MSRFRIGDKVESEFFPDVQTIEEVSGNAVRVTGQWLLDKQVELIEHPKLKTEPLAYIVEEDGHSPIKIVNNPNAFFEPVQGRKDDQDKPDLSLLPKEALEAMAYAFMHGGKKYGRYNYRKGMQWHRPLAAALRHIVAFTAGENKDPESGHSHLGHALAAIAMVAVYQETATGTDTRYKKV